MKKVFNKSNFFIFVAIFVLVLFSYITYKTPLAGDDWGYAINGSIGTPIKTAIDFYYNWSGRFFSELWGMLIPKNKWLWNIINPLLFTGIFIFIYKISDVKNNKIISSLFILAFMLSVDDNLRMETYTWIMGTTYIVPLFFSLVYFYITIKYIETNDKKYKTLNGLSNVLLFIIGLMMENIAATMIVGIVILIIYVFINKKEINKYLIINLLFSILSFTILRLSPGSASRLLNDNATWASLSLFEKISSAYPNFLSISFLNNNYAIALFSLVLIICVLSSNKNNLVYKTISIIISILGIISVFYFVIGDSFINNPNSIYSYIFWPIYVINVFITIYLFIRNKEKSIFFLIIAGCSVLVMLYSPIYGSRSAIYLVYYLIIVSLYLINEIEIKNKYLLPIAFLLLLIIIGDRTIEYYEKYKIVGLRQEERLEIINYYQGHPEDEEAWIPRFPIFTIHGADIEPEDTYHLETFKEYYHLPQQASKIIFYFVEEE